MTNSTIKEGDLIEIKLKDKTLKGKLMPSKDTLILKLDSGYNIGIDKTKIKEKTLIEKSKPVKTQKQTIKQDKNLPKISILHTGGTVASKVDYETGGVSAKFTPEDLLNMVPELKAIANIDSKLISNMFSEDMRFAHYNVLVKAIQKELKNKPKGIIITHGTDTLAYTSAALAFMLENIQTPIILVGAQRSSDRGSTDAFLNLICATKFIAETDFKGVAICMHESTNDNTCLILPATKTRKMHTSKRDAFKPINAQPIARLNLNKIEFIDYPEKPEAKPLKIRLMNPNIKIGILKQHPNMFAEEILAYKNYDGLVIEATGLGNLPINHIDKETAEHDKILKALQTLINKDIIIILAPQTTFGRLNLNVYSGARKQKEIGIQGDQSDMLPETTFIKLAWLLSNYKKEEIPELLRTNLRGELNPRLLNSDYMI